MTFAAIKKLFPRAHIEICRGTPQQNKDYCAKGGDYFEFGELPRKGARKDLEEFNEAIVSAKGGYSVRQAREEFPSVMARYEKYAKQRMNDVIIDNI